MKRGLLLAAQLSIALIIMTQALIFSAVLGLPILRGIMAGTQTGIALGPEETYFRCAIVAVVSVDASALIWFSGVAVLLIRNPSRSGAWLSVAGAICYWIFVISYLAMISTQGPLRDNLTITDGIVFPIGIVAAAIALAIYSTERRPRSAVQDDTAQS